MPGSGTVTADAASRLTLSRPLLSSPAGSRFKNPIRVEADVAVNGIVNCSQLITGPGVELVLVAKGVPLIRTSTVLVVPKPVPTKNERL